MRRGLSGIAITDHNTISGGLEVKKVNKDRKFTVIVGSEIQTEVGDIIGLFLNEEIKTRNSVEVIEEIKDQGGYVILPHPYRGHKLNKNVITKSDAIEIFNGRSTYEENNLALELAKKLDKPVTVGSDAHFACEIGKSFLNTDYDLFRNFMENSIANTYEYSGEKCPRYCIDASQAIKSFKMRNFLHSFRHLGFFFYHTLNER